MACWRPAPRLPAIPPEYHPQRYGTQLCQKYSPGVDTGWHYTPAQMASLMQSSINGVKAFSDVGSTVSASIDGTGKLVLVSSRYGSVSALALSNGTGTGVETLLGAVAVKGADVAGTLGGQPVIGSGQTLTGAHSSQPTA